MFCVVLERCVGCVGGVATADSLGSRFNGLCGVRASRLEMKCAPLQKNPTSVFAAINKMALAVDILMMILDVATDSQATVTAIAQI